MIFEDGLLEHVIEDYKDACKRLRECIRDATYWHRKYVFSSATIGRAKRSNETMNYLIKWAEAYAVSNQKGFFVA